MMASGTDTSANSFQQGIANISQQLELFSQTGRAMWVVFGVAFVMRVLYFLQATDNPFLYIQQLDEEFYVNFGRSLVDSTAGIQAFYMDPLYGYYLGGLFNLFGDNLIIPRLIQVVTDSGAALLMFLLARRLWSSSAGFSAGIIYACYPVCWFYSLTLLKTTFTTDFAILFTYILLLCIEQQYWRKWLLLGVLTGVGVYLRGNLILLLPLTALIPLLYRQDSMKRAFQFSATYVLGACIIVAGAGLLNKLAFGEFTVLPNTGGTTLYGANNPDNLHGENKNPPFISRNHPSEIYQQYKAEAEKRLGKNLSDSQVSSYWRGEAVNYWFSDAAVLPVLLLNKLGHLLSHKEIANNQSIEIAARFAPVLLPQIPFYSLILAFGLPGLLLAIRKDRRVLVLLPVLGVVLITSLVYFSSSRFRLPLVPVLIIGSVYYFIFIQGLTAKRSKHLLLAAALLIFVISLSLDGPPENIAQQEINLALAHAELGETARAVDLLARLEGQMDNDTYYQKIRSYVSLLAKDYAAAYRYSTMALANDPADHGTMSIAGIAALELNDRENALEWFSRALQVSSDNEMHYWIGKTQLLMGNHDIAQHHLSMAVTSLPQSSNIAAEAEKLMRQLQK